MERGWNLKSFAAHAVRIQYIEKQNKRRKFAAAYARMVFLVQVIRKISTAKPLFTPFFGKVTYLILE